MLAQLRRRSRNKARFADRLSKAHGSLCFALVVSSLLHLTVLVSDLGVDEDRRYPSFLAVTLLPGHLPDRLPRQKILAPETVPVFSPESLAVAKQPAAEKIELTPKPVDDEFIAQPKAFISAFALTKRPGLLNPEWLEGAAWRLPVRAEGEAVLTVSITRDGLVADVQVDDSASPEFASWLAGEFRAKARFSPGYVRDLAVDSKIRIRIELGALVR